MRASIDGASVRRGGQNNPFSREMARVTGLEPATSGVTGRRSNQLSYTRVGIPAQRRGALSYFCSRPRSSAFAGITHMVRRRRLVGGDGLEPPTLSV